MAHTFRNSSFEAADGQAATLTSGLEPFSLADGSALSVATSGGVESIVFLAGTQSSALSVVGPFPIADGLTLDVEIDGGVAQTVTFLAAQFLDIGAATPAEMAAALMPVVGSFALVEDGAVRFGSATRGGSSLVAVVGGTAAPAFGFAVAAPGVSYFVDIGAATAAEVAARVTAQADNFLASDAAGRVILTSADHGDDATLQVVSGSVASILGFPTSVVRGVTHLGMARGWSVTSTATHWELADFHSLELFPSAIEGFELGWNNEDTTELGDVALVAFTGGYSADGFEQWAPLVDVLPAMIAAGFDAALRLADSEDFGQGWPEVPGNEWSRTVIGPTTAAVFASGAVEAFESAWPVSPGNDQDVTALSPLTAAVFGGATNAETFTSTTAVALHYRVTNALPVAGHEFAIFLDGVEHSLLLDAPTTDIVVAIQLVATLNGSVVPVSATNDQEDIYITQDTPGAPLVYSKRATPATGLVLVLGEEVDPTTDWPGLYRNPAL